MIKSPDQLKQPEISDSTERKRKFAATALAFAVLLPVGAAGAGEANHGNFNHYFNQLKDMVLNDGAETVRAETKALINDLADSPTSGDYMRYAELAKDAVPIRDVDGDGTLESDDVEPGQKSRSELYLDLTQEVAPKYGLHLIDPTERVKRLQSADNVQAVLDELQSHMGDLGIPIVLHETLDSKDARVDAEPFDPNSLEMSQDLIDGVSSFIYSTSYVPKELYEFIDIKEIRIVDTFKPTDNPIVGEFTAAGKAMMDDGIIYLPKSYLLQGDFDLIMHEVSHLLDYRLNGDSYDATYEDQEFTALNKEEFDYGDPNEDMSDMVALYSATNPVEDKATLMETMINGLSRVYLYHENPIIRNKYRLLLGRIEQNVPGYSQYMLSIIEHKRIPAPEYS